MKNLLGTIGGVIILIILFNVYGKYQEAEAEKRGFNVFTETTKEVQKTWISVKEGWNTDEIVIKDSTEVKLDTL